MSHVDGCFGGPELKPWDACLVAMLDNLSSEQQPSPFPCDDMPSEQRSSRFLRAKGPARMLQQNNRRKLEGRELAIQRACYTSGVLAAIPCWSPVGRLPTIPIITNPVVTIARSCHLSAISVTAHLHGTVPLLTRRTRGCTCRMAHDVVGVV